MSEEILNDYLAILRQMDLMNRRFSEIIKIELDRNNIYDLKPDQAMLLFLIGGDEVTATEIMQRGYYSGTNVSYICQKLKQFDYINTTFVENDKRAVHIKLTNKGEHLFKLINDAVARHTKHFEANKLKFEQINYAVLVLRRIYQLLGDFKI